MLLAAVAIGNDFNYVINTNTTIGVMAALTVLTGAVNSLSTYWMEKMTKTYVIFHVIILISCSIALLVLTDNKHDANYVFTDIEPTSGWAPVGFSFLFGFLSVSWTMTDYDATAHITEEINQPEIKAPWAISMAMLFTYLSGFLFNIVLCFCMVCNFLPYLAVQQTNISHRATQPRSSPAQLTNPSLRSSTTASAKEAPSSSQLQA
jgi:amino acid transporter